ncbi:MAG: ribonuclease J [Eubacteriaceae bacterium]|nr:ribonuclease J [Eubacteriaceae bacterium]
MKTKATGATASTQKNTKTAPATQNTKTKQANEQNKSKKKASDQKNFRVIALGGLEEIGKNCTVIECEDDMIILDCGIKFPDIDMFGVDLVMPDFTYLEGKENRIRGLFITHGHEDHIGGIPYFLQKFPKVPVYGTKLTIGLIRRRLTEHNLDKKANLNVVGYHSTINVKGFSVEFVVTNHSIADSAAFYIRCKGGSIFLTGDFKFDLTPIDGHVVDLPRIAEIGKEGVDLLICDSTNAAKKGYSLSEKVVGEEFANLFANIKKRIVIATFSTSIHRIQQIFDTARAHRRKVVVSGRSMTNVISVAKELRYLKFKDSILVDIKDLPKYQPEQIVLITTGSQGEPMSALSRMAYGEHRQLTINEDDFVIISASPIPGNEKAVANIISEIMKLGAEVIYQGSGNVHVSGHGCQEEIKLLITLLNPAYYMPCHGEYNMLASNAKLAASLGKEAERIFILKNGDILEVSKEKSAVVGTAPAGIVLIDGLGVGDVGNVVLKDRKRLSQDGLLIVVAAIDETGIISGPDIVSRGFVYMKESEALMRDAKALCERTIANHRRNYSDYNSIKNDVKYELEKFLFDTTKRKPVILPILMYPSKTGNKVRAI